MCANLNKVKFYSIRTLTTVRDFVPEFTRFLSHLYQTDVFLLESGGP